MSDVDWERSVWGNLITTSFFRSPEWLKKPRFKGFVKQPEGIWKKIIICPYSM